MLVRGFACGAVLALAACSSDAPVASLCLINCTVIVRTSSSGDDEIREAEKVRLQEAKDAFKRFEHGKVPPDP
ncbi:hypothetical protein GCM10028796_46630 [Ramlibacter monticola]|uniref:Uncharacterized protein n=1 Tax=Ramlibacter monticola TaxID=1926872 RepID=A0A936Z3R0_9BURK|nr:hypothetical protein [Ramlibacter monticola]MBL0394288.1 hypothetical protein [Ramlibacter monticola]